MKFVVRSSHGKIHTTQFGSKGHRLLRALKHALREAQEPFEWGLLGSDKTNTFGVSYKRLILEELCVYCFKPAETVDHIIPKVQGGKDTWRNLAPTCQKCNGFKGSRSILQMLVDPTRHLPSRRARKRMRKQKCSSFTTTEGQSSI